MASRGGTIEQAAAKAKVTPKTVYEWMAAGRASEESRFHTLAMEWDAEKAEHRIRNRETAVGIRDNAEARDRDRLRAAAVAEALFNKDDENDSGKDQSGFGHLISRKIKNAFEREEKYDFEDDAE